MGTTSQKIQYLGETKDLLKDSINSLGGNITSQTTFRQYATELDSIYASLPKVSGTGSSISLSPTRKGRLGSTLKGNTLQDGTPTPDSPIEIQSVTGRQEISVCGKNLFNGNLFTSLTANSDGTYKTNTAYTAATNVPFKLKPNTNYVISLRDENYDLISGNFGIYVDDVYVGPSTTGNYKFTTSSSKITNIKIAASGWSTVGIANRYIQLEVGTEATTYEAYQSQTKELNLGTIKLNKIGDYQDYITGTPNNWSIKRKIKESFINFNGTYYNASETQRYAWFSKSNNSIDYNAWTSNVMGESGTILGNGNKFSYGLVFNPNDYTDEQIVEYCNNTKYIYVLATETTEAITNQEIINQLNEIYYLQSYNGTTNITITSEDLELIMTASAIKGE